MTTHIKLVSQKSSKYLYQAQLSLTSTFYWQISIIGSLHHAFFQHVPRDSLFEIWSDKNPKIRKTNHCHNMSPWVKYHVMWSNTTKQVLLFSLYRLFWFAEVFSFLFRLSLILFLIYHTLTLVCKLCRKITTLLANAKTAQFVFPWHNNSYSRFNIGSMRI